MPNGLTSFFSLEDSSVPYPDYGAAYQGYQKLQMQFLVIRGPGSDS